LLVEVEGNASDNCSVLAEANFRFAVVSSVNAHNYMQHTNQMSAVGTEIHTTKTKTM
jgi:hypothetical protein